MSTYQPMPKLANLAIPFPSDEPENEKREFAASSKAGLIRMPAAPQMPKERIAWLSPMVSTEPARAEQIGSHRARPRNQNTSNAPARHQC
jgi:hypothetical protein